MSEPTYYRCWLDSDGIHVWAAHLCNGALVSAMLPHPQWWVQKDSGGQVAPSFNCEACRTHVELWLDTVGGDHPLVDDVASVLGENKRLRAERDALRLTVTAYEKQARPTLPVTRGSGAWTAAGGEHRLYADGRWRNIAGAITARERLAQDVTYVENVGEKP